MDVAMVKVGDQFYSIVEPPAASSPVVLKAKGNILGHIDLAALVDDLGRLGNCVRIAYHGVAGHTELQIEIQRIGYDVTKLCDKSAITVAHFKKASSTVTLTLQATYEYLLDGLEDMAIETLADITGIAKGMAAAAESLNIEFDEQSQVVIEALEKVQREHGSQEEEKKKIVQERENMQADVEKMKATREEAQKLAKSTEKLFFDAKQKEEEALSKPNEVETTVVHSFLGIFRSEKTVMVPTHWRETAQFARQEKMKHLEKMYEQQSLRSNAIVELAAYATNIGNLKTDESQIAAAVKALVAAIGALKSLAAIMLQAAQFWKQMQHHCDDLASDKMKKEIERTLKLTVERRLHAWTSNAFKRKAIDYYAGWVALDDVCSIYVERIKLTRKELYLYIQEALPTDEARERVVDLAREFGISLKKEQDAIEERKIKQQEEMDTLMGQIKLMNTEP